MAPRQRQQLARCGGGRQAALGHLLGEGWQGFAHLGHAVKLLLESGLDALPHPSQGLLLSAGGQAAVVGLQALKRAHLMPKRIDPLAKQSADAHHLGMPNALVMVGMLGVAVQPKQPQ